MDNKLLYFTQFHYHAAQSLFNNQKLVIPKPVPETNSIRNQISCFYDFKITEAYRNEWKELMKINNNDTFVPFTYHWPWTITGLVEHLLPGLGLSLKNYLHVGQKIDYLGSYSTSSQMRYTNWNTLVDLCPVGKDRMAIISESSVHDQTGKIIVKTLDYSYVLKMTPEEINALSTFNYCNRTDVSVLRNNFSGRIPRFAQSGYKYSDSFFCYEGMGIRYGCVSGALNTTHTFKTISPLFGHKRPFLQGMCTGNIVLSLICMKFGRELDHFEVFFNNKLFTPQKVELRFDEREFELFDESGKVVSFGTYKVTDE